LFTIWCEISRSVWIWKGLLHILSMAPAIVIMVIIAKNGIVETSQKYNIWYVTKTNFLCRFRIWSQNSNIPSVSNVIAWFVQGSMILINFENLYIIICHWVQNAIEFTPPQRDYEYLICVPCYGYYGQYFQNSISETLSACNILYITRTSFWCRFRISNQNFNMVSVSCVIT
jgi:hypothetical protein